MKRGPYYGGRIHVVSAKCSTCVFRAGNLMRLHDGRLADLVEHNRKHDTALQCHKTLDYTPDAYPPAVCRGYYDAYMPEITPLRMAAMLDLITFDVWETP